MGYLAGEALGDGDALGDAEALEAWALELGPPGRRLVGRFTEGELEPGSPRPPGDFDLVLGREKVPLLFFFYLLRISG